MGLLNFIFCKLRKSSKQENIEQLTVLAQQTSDKYALIHDKNARKQLAKLAKMKSGSIALVDQIITVSKLRIYDPRSSKDMLYGIKVSNITMTNIDAKIKKLYIA